jgi:hypothetical protein
LGIFGVLILVVIQIAAIAGIRSSLRTRALERPVPHGITTTGQVIAVKKIRARGYVYAPIVQFADASGRTYQFTAPTSSNEPRVGSVARVSYDPSNPNHAHDLSNSAEAWKAPYFTGVGVALMAGLMLIVIVVSLPLQARRKHLRSDDIRDPGLQVPLEKRRRVTVWSMRVSGLLLAPVPYFALSSNGRHLVGLASAVVYLTLIVGASIIVDRALRRRAADTVAPAGSQ